MRSESRTTIFADQCEKELCACLPCFICAFLMWTCVTRMSKAACLPYSSDKGLYSLMNNDIFRDACHLVRDTVTVQFS
jgi:hypothetical protein